MNAASSPSFSVGEYWDSNTSVVDSWTSAANSSAFDFALYTMQTFATTQVVAEILPTCSVDEILRCEECDEL